MKKLNKKGFTLVELIVVIAIIGVLAAILVPTLMGYVHSSRVTSADTLASDLKRNVGYFLTEADTAGYGMKKASGMNTDVTIKVVDYEWEITVTDPTVFAEGDFKWDGVTTTVNVSTNVSAITNADGFFAYRLLKLFPDVKNAYIGMKIHEGTCAALYIANDTLITPTILAFDNDGWSAEVYMWNGETEAVCDEGYIVGTAPKLKLGHS